MESCSTLWRGNLSSLYLMLLFSLWPDPLEISFSSARKTNTYRPGGASLAAAVKYRECVSACVGTEQGAICVAHEWQEMTSALFSAHEAGESRQTASSLCVENWDSAQITGVPSALLRPKVNVKTTSNISERT